MIYVDISFACFGIQVDERGIIVRAAPVARGWIGRPASAMRAHYLARGQLKQWSAVG